jgi:hypothetical protein
MNIVKATRRFEEWLRQRTVIVETDLQAKHKHMAEGCVSVSSRYVLSLDASLARSLF